MMDADGRPVNPAMLYEGLFQHGKGIMCVGERTLVLADAIKDAGVRPDDINRGNFLKLLLTAPNLEKYISGAILSEECLNLKTENGTLLIDDLKQRGIAPGIRVDRETFTLPESPNDSITIGLDRLSERLNDYKNRRLAFVSWRTLFGAGAELPGTTVIEANCHMLAIYALLSQHAGLLPMIEIRVAPLGNRSLDAIGKTHETILQTLFKMLSDYKVLLSRVAIRINMVTLGASGDAEASVDDIAKATVNALAGIMALDLPVWNTPKPTPPPVDQQYSPGWEPPKWKALIYLSDYGSDEQAAVHLNAISSSERPRLDTSFCFGEFLQKEARALWAKNPTNNVSPAQDLVIERAKQSQAASIGF